MSGRQADVGTILVAAVLVTTAFAPVTLAAGIDDQSRSFVATHEIPSINSSSINETTLAPYHATPEPVTIFKTGVSDTSLPGPRSMAFGPSVIGISVSPVILSTLIVLAFLGIAAWGIRNCSRRDDEREDQ
jgi:hypothetical protein